jgi:aryl-alcohol dehydrogenase-like predicted oxidoreductase
MKTRRIGPFDVAGFRIGLGCMNLSHAYGAPPPADGPSGCCWRRWTWA